MTERGGKPIASALTAGQRHESTQAIPLLERATAHLWPNAVAGDKGYNSSALRNWLLHREMEGVIPYRADKRGARQYDWALYHERSRIERLINRLKRFRWIATRDDKLAISYLAMVTIAMILEWL